MADLSSIGDLIAGFVPEGPLRTAVFVAYGLCAVSAPFIYKYFLGVLAQGAKPDGSIERQDYDKLRASLAGGNLAARLYAKWLTTFLEMVERFFGDSGMADRTLFPRAFGLKKTRAALDGACLRSLPLSHFNLPGLDNFPHLGGFRPCPPGGGGCTSSKA